MSTRAAGPVKFADKLARLTEYWSPRVIAELNDYPFKIAKLSGEFVWHSHADTGEAFIVLSGALAIDLPDRTVEFREGEMYVVPRGMEHRPRAAPECHLLLVESRGVVNTGDAGGELTAESDRWIE